MLLRNPKNCTGNIRYSNTKVGAFAESNTSVLDERRHCIFAFKMILTQASDQGAFLVR